MKSENAMIGAVWTRTAGSHACTSPARGGIVLDALDLHDALREGDRQAALAARCCQHPFHVFLFVLRRCSTCDHSWGRRDEGGDETRGRQAGEMQGGPPARRRRQKRQRAVPTVRVAAVTDTASARKASRSITGVEACSV